MSLAALLPYTSSGMLPAVLRMQSFLYLGLSSLVPYENSARPQASVFSCLVPISHSLKVALGINVVHVSLRWQMQPCGGSHHLVETAHVCLWDRERSCGKRTSSEQNRISFCILSQDFKILTECCILASVLKLSFWGFGLQLFIIWRFSEQLKLLGFTRYQSSPFCFQSWTVLSFPGAKAEAFFKIKWLLIILFLHIQNFSPLCDPKSAMNLILCIKFHVFNQCQV